MAKNRLTKKIGNGAKRKKRKAPYNNFKAKNQRTHARNRASQRYGLSLNRTDLESIGRLITHGHSPLLSRASGRVATYLVQYRGQRMPVVYDEIRSTVVTVLPEQPKGVPENILQQAKKVLDARS